MKPIHIAIFCSALWLTACSPAMTPEEGKVANAPKATCTVETPTGSNMPRRVCKTAEEREADRNESQRTLEQRAYRPSGMGDKPASSL